MAAIEALMHLKFTIFLLLVTATAIHARGAGVTVTLPLEGYYRPGQLMPVRIAWTTTPGNMIELKAVGAIPTRVHVGGATVDGVFPWLVHSDQPTEIQILENGAPSSLQLDLKPLSSDERLVGVGTAQMPSSEWLQDRFPGKKVIPVRIAAADLTRGPVSAWGVLDALVIDAATIPSAGKMPDGQPIDTWERRIEKWLLEGIQVIVRGVTEFNFGTPIPWTQLNDSPSDWIAGIELTGPKTFFEPDAYMPVVGWNPGRPDAFRKQLMLRGVLFAILVLIAALWRPRAAPWTMLAIVICFIPAIAFWETLQPTLVSKSGTILAPQDAGTQHDTWTYSTVLKQQNLGDYHPVFASPRHAEQLDAILTCTATAGGHVAFQYRLQPGQRIASLDRTLEPRIQLPTRPDESIFTRFAEREYTSSTWRVKGVAVTVPLEMRMPGQDWNIVVLEKTEPASLRR